MLALCGVGGRGKNKIKIMTHLGTTLVLYTNLNTLTQHFSCPFSGVLFVLFLCQHTNHFAQAPVPSSPWRKK
jgi:hypothetical protein